MLVILLNCYLLLSHRLHLQMLWHLNYLLPELIMHSRRTGIKEWLLRLHGNVIRHHLHLVVVLLHLLNIILGLLLQLTLIHYLSLSLMLLKLLLLELQVIELVLEVVDHLLLVVTILILSCQSYYLRRQRPQVFGIILFLKLLFALIWIYWVVNI